MGDVDLDAFPQTPTVEQLGLSKAALDLVGDRRRGGAAGARQSASARLHSLLAASSDTEGSAGLRHSLGGSNTASLASRHGTVAADRVAPRMTDLRSPYSTDTNTDRLCLATNLTDLSVDSRSRNAPEMTCRARIDWAAPANSPVATPTITNGPAHTSPFGGASSTSTRASRSPVLTCSLWRPAVGRLQFGAGQRVLNKFQCYLPGAM